MWHWYNVGEQSVVFFTIYSITALFFKQYFLQIHPVIPLNTADGSLPIYQATHQVTFFR